MRFEKVALYILVALSLGLYSCEGYFGDKTNIDFIQIPDYQNRAVAYVPIQPVLDKFVKPVDVLAGFDELIYVVDQGTQQIVAFDQSGRELYSVKVPGVYKVVQDRSLDLLALGTKDTTIAGKDYTLSCIYRLDLKNASSFGLSNAKVVSEIVHPFYFKKTFSSSDAIVRFKGIAILHDNQYYVTRQGQSNNPNQFGGPDNAVLIFNEKDKFVSPINVTTSGGVFKDFFKMPQAITTAVQPPQINASKSKNFLYTSVDPNFDNQFRVRVIGFVETEFGVDYVPNGRVREDTSKASGFLTEPNKFSQPSGITVSGDGTNFIFVVDAQKDSLYQFTFNGLEGVKPPAGSAEKKYIKTSFGGKGVALTQFNKPTAVAYLEKIVYVADSENGRVLRFKLTSDFR